ncbi:hypothetical protein C7B69_24215 [filamentous cyanobacterium Phorm 46]|nr:hypothetical protein C7B69_24215 [filamentous cyanobacterium Phorm 46]PSB51160.1 hypothetical protein C7B67_11965 [filamentous cyanobacterium Phorm 6]
MDFGLRGVEVILRERAIGNNIVREIDCRITMKLEAVESSTIQTVDYPEKPSTLQVILNIWYARS